MICPGAPDSTESTALATFTSFDGIEIYYQEFGEPSSLPPVVLHHGFVADATLNWVATGIVLALTAAGSRVVALDARGHGRSQKPTDPAAYGEATMARDLELLVATLGMANFDLVGYSMGAVVSLIAASGDERVRRLVVGGIGAGVVELGGVDTRLLPAVLLAEGLEAEDPSTIEHPDVIAFRAFAEAVGGDRPALAAQARAVHSSPIALDRIGAPVLVIAGDDDRLAERPDVLVDALPDARLFSVPGDHVTALVDPRFAAGIVDFLA